jgi:type IV fimbrial biogenesis protein FimT
MWTLRTPGYGHTLVELLVVLGLAALLAGLATPGFREVRANAVRDARLEELRGTLLLARTEAVARGTPVVVCASTDGRACDDGPRWSRGWVALADADAPLAVVGPHATVAVHSTRTAIQFQPSAAAATTATLTVCDARGPRAARALVVSRTGRVRTATGPELRCA